MAIETFTAGCAPGVHDVDISVTVTSSMLTVHSGTFRVSREDYELLEDQEWELVGSAERAVSIYLVKAREGGAVSVLVDEVESGDELHRFDDDSPYQLLYLVAEVHLASGVTSLEDASVTVRRIIPREKEARAWPPTS